MILQGSERRLSEASEAASGEALPGEALESSYVYVGSQMRRSLSVFTAPLQESCSSRWT